MIVNTLALIGTAAIVYHGYRLYAAYKPKIMALLNLSGNKPADGGQ